MKRDRLLKYMISDINNAIASLEANPDSKPYIADRLATNLLDLLIGLGVIKRGLSFDEFISESTLEEE